MKKTFLIILALSFLIISCSAVKYGYDKLYYYVYQKVDDYFDLNEKQSEFVKEQMKTYFSWLKRNDLIKMKILMKDIKSNTDNMTMSSIKQYDKRARNLFYSSVDRLEPDIIVFLNGLSNEQINHYREYLQKNRDKKRLDQFKKKDSDYYNEKYDALFENLEKYFGDIKKDQKKKIMQVYVYNKSDEKIMFQDDLRSRERFLSIVKEDRGSREFPDKIRNVLHSGNLLFNAEEKRRRDEYQQKNLERMYSIFRIIDEEQKDHFKAVLDEYIEIIDSILEK